MTDNMIAWDVDADGIVTLTMDDPTQGANTMNALFQDSLAATVARLQEERENITGVVLTSAKGTFFAGGDLKLLSQAQPEQAAELEAQIDDMKAQLRTLETLGVPVVAAINGAALGGGLELALACHHRVALAGKGKIGLPEVTLGLLPGGGGVVRTVRMFGLQKALMEILLQGQQRNVQAALEVGLVDEIVETPRRSSRHPRAGSRPTPTPCSRGTPRATRCPGRPVEPQVCRDASRLPRQPA